MEIESALWDLRKKLDDVNPGVRIIAATKTRSPEEIERCMATGLCLAAGENRVQEFNEKYNGHFRWDFIGQLQTNKVKYLVGRAALIHSVDRSELASVIDKFAEKKGVVQDVLIEINTGNELSKGGILLEDLPAFLTETERYEHIRIRGLMAVAPITTEDKLRTLFSKTHDAFEKYKNSTFDTLSMGMSSDCFLAAECGSNTVRVGRGIFGERSY